MLKRERMFTFLAHENQLPLFFPCANYGPKVNTIRREHDKTESSTVIPFGDILVSLVHGRSRNSKARFKRRTSHEPNRMLMKLNEGEQRFFFICIRFGSCEVRRLNLAKIKIFRRTSLNLFIVHILS